MSSRSAFTARGAFEEVARAKSDGLNIRLIRVKELLLMIRRPGNPLTKHGPQPDGEILPIPPMRKAKDLPSAEQLVESAPVAKPASPAPGRSVACN